VLGPWARDDQEGDDVDHPHDGPPPVSGPDPISRQRSEWQRLSDQLLDGFVTECYRRNVHDGYLAVLWCPTEPGGAHLSISHTKPAKRGGGPGRYPTWDEIAGARYHFMPDEMMVAMFLPPRDLYVAVHMTTFHLHEIKA
jgi:hypothetical protein